MHTTRTDTTTWYPVPGHHTWYVPHVQVHTDSHMKCRASRKKPESRCWANIHVLAEREGSRFLTISYTAVDVDGELPGHVHPFYFVKTNTSCKYS